MCTKDTHKESNSDGEPKDDRCRLRHSKHQKDSSSGDEERGAHDDLEGDTIAAVARRELSEDGGAVRDG